MAMEESHETGKNLVKPGRSQMTIDILPDIALLEFFDFYVAQASDPPVQNRETWITLVHVCRKWRDIVFGSPRRLSLRLLVTPRRSVRTMLDIWPPLLFDIWGFGVESWGNDTIISALEHDNRIRQIELFHASGFQMEQTLAAMRKPFPALIGLALNFFDQGGWPVIPDSFLGESAPRLESLRLFSFPFPLPALKKLVLSATDLTEIRILRIPDSWYISPEEIVTCLSTLIRLKELELGFQSRDNWGSRPLPPSTRCVLPALTSLRFKGVYEYMEDLMARIDAPQLDNLKLFLFDQPVLDTPQLAQFIGRIPRFKALNELHVLFDYRGIFILLPQTLRRGLQFGVLRGHSGVYFGPANQHSVLVELCTLSFLRTLIPIVKRLYILGSRSRSMYWRGGIENSQWLELLHPFTAVKDLYLSREFAPFIAPALRGSVGEGMLEVLPALQNLFLERLPSPEPVEETIRQFVAARQLSSHQIAISYWDGERDPWLEHEDAL